MVTTMKTDLFSPCVGRTARSGLLALVACCLAATPALAEKPAASGTSASRATPAAPATPRTPRTHRTPVDTSACVAPALTQALLPFGDSNWYATMPGDSADAFTGAGWTLSRGASIKTVRLADGSTGPVLDMPSGSTAVSPTICINNTYPFARTEVRGVVGSQGIMFAVANRANKTWSRPRTTGQYHGSRAAWTLSKPINLKPDRTPGWQLVRFTFTAQGKRSDFQVYNFYVDPRCRG